MTEDAGDMSLSEMCSICHSNPPKYKCPRCSIKTCSLPCTKRHKLLSECSGIRDPAAYRKRRELATPASFDQDFNFIAGLERSLERAEQNATDRGITLKDGKHQRPVRGEHRLRVELEGSGVMVRKAPTGMSRNKHNKSHWNQKHKHISWTIEWILEDGRKVLANSLETTTIQQAYINAVPKRLQPTRKRKLEDPTQEQDLAQISTTEETETTGTENSTTESSRQSEPDMYFYLHRPDITDGERAVQHVPCATILQVALRGRLVLEFPSFYVLSSAPDAMPQGFRLVENDQPAAQPVTKAADEATAVPVPEPDSLPESPSVPQLDLDDRRIIDALEQDLGS